jgi:thiol-disulfide isomerase/thioredoxin
MNTTQQPSLPPHMRRRLFVGVAGAAALAGVGVAWWRSQPSGTRPDTVQILVPGFWDLQWEMPQGGVLPMRSLQGKPLLINFWATWCPPCVEELPLINAFYQKNRTNGWQVLGLAVDRLAPVQSFLKNMPLDFGVGMAGTAGTDLARGLGNLTGGLPFSVVVNSGGVVAQRKMGRLQAEDLDAWTAIK